ncbi:MAG: hypothetical protein P8179_20740 [Candidatus Thiodiazotropha sp.]
MATRSEAQLQKATNRPSALITEYLETPFPESVPSLLTLTSLTPLSEVADMIPCMPKASRTPSTPYNHSLGLLQSLYAFEAVSQMADRSEHPQTQGPILTEAVAAQTAGAP